MGLLQYLRVAKDFESSVDSPTVGSLLINHCARSASYANRERLETVLEVSMNNVSLYRQLFC